VCLKGKDISRQQSGIPEAAKMADFKDYELPNSDDDMWAAIEGNRDDSISQVSTSTKVVPISPISVPTAHLPSKVDGKITDDAEDSPTEDSTDEEYADDEFLASLPESPVGIQGDGQAYSRYDIRLCS
jgi:hypothetical protein